jgi:hypothetical protein
VKLWSVIVNFMLVVLMLWNVQLQRQIKEVQSVASLAEIQQLIQQIKDDLPFLIQRSQIQPQQVAIGEGLSDISKRLGLVQAGEFRSGNGLEPGRGFSGVRIGYPSFTYGGELWNIVGVDNDTLQMGVRASDGKLIAGGGNVVLGADGILFANNQQSALAFEDTVGGTETIIIYSSGSDELVLANQTGSDGIRINTDSATHQVLEWRFIEDTGLAERALLVLTPATKGARLNVGNEIFIDGEGGSGGQTAITFYPSSVTPSTPSATNEASVYIKGTKLIFQYNDAGTVRYKYLDLTGTGVTWVHTTTAP